jgi:hypothetical protein
MNLEDRYLVLDVETNGLNCQTDDLLSISIFRPDTGLLINRFLPLSLQKDVYTTRFNGITKDQLKGKRRMNQEEVDWLIDNFEIKKRVVLTYGNLDKRFLRCFFERNHLKGFPFFNFYNFKHDIISSRYSGGIVTKDNLCTMLGMKNVKAVHSGENDCRLEWSLFKAMNGKKWLITDQDVFEYNPDYIVPASFLANYRNLRYVRPDLPTIEGKVAERRVFSVSKGTITEFLGNASGITIEHLINSMLKTESVDSLDFLRDNKRKLRYIGSLPSPYVQIPIMKKDDGTISAINPQDQNLIDRINSSTLELKNKLGDLVRYLKEDVFHNQKILTQELVVNKEANVLALCDLSTEETVVELKAFYRPDEDPRVFQQLYYEARGREAYSLCIDWNNDLHYTHKSVNFVLRRIVFTVQDPKEARIKNLKPLKDKNLSVVDFTDYRSPVKLHCKKCGNDFVVSGASYRQVKCPFCRQNESLEDRKEKRRLSHDQEAQTKKYKAKVKALCGDNIIVLKYDGSRAFASFMCTKCRGIWQRRAYHFLSHPFCPNCRKKK